MDVLAKGKKLLKARKFKEAFPYFQKANELIDKLSVREQVIFYAQWSQVCEGAGFYNDAEKYGQLAISLTKDRLSKTSTIQTLLPKLYTNLAQVFKTQAKYVKVLSLLQKGLKILEKKSNNDFLHMSTLMADTYVNLGQNEQALDLYQKLLKEAISFKAHEHVSIIINNIAVAYIETEQYSKALLYCQQALDYLEANSIKYQKSKVLQNMGNIHVKLGNFKEGINHYEQALHTKDGMKDQSISKVTLQCSLANFYIKTGNLSKAENNLQEVLKKSEKLKNNALLLQVLLLYVDFYKLQKNHEKALYFFEKYSEVYEEQYTTELANKLKEAEESYAVLEEKLKNELLQKQNKRVKTLLEDLHHRVKNDFQTINNLIQFQTSVQQDIKVKSGLRDVLARTQAMTFLHQKLYKEDKISVNNLQDYLPEIITNLSYSYQKDFTPNIKIDNIELSAKKAKAVGLIINELVSNIFKYAFPEKWQETPNVMVTVEKINVKKLQIIVQDNGIGVPKDWNWQETTSTGLKIVQTWVNNLKATLRLDKKHIVGTRWILLMPLEN